MMKLIIGLGNPGRKFAKTRHNVGHLFISKGKRKKEKFGDRVRLVKTSVLMNDSGKEVAQLATRYQLSAKGGQGRFSALPITNLLIVHDDMDLPLGEFKLQFGRSAAWHKGVQSVIDALGTNEFWRLRFGIGAPPPDVSGEDYVLSEFGREELDQIQEAFERAYPRVLEWIRNRNEGPV